MIYEVTKSWRTLSIPPDCGTFLSFLCQSGTAYHCRTEECDIFCCDMLPFRGDVPCPVTVAKITTISVQASCLSVVMCHGV